MGVSIIATALVHTALQGLYSGSLHWISGHGKWQYIANYTRKLYICEGLS